MEQQRRRQQQQHATSSSPLSLSWAGCARALGLQSAVRTNDNAPGGSG
jgi:hypothetical protein